jgi:hypothetical protein
MIQAQSPKRRRGAAKAPPELISAAVFSPRRLEDHEGIIEFFFALFASSRFGF